MTLSVVVPTYNRGDRLGATIDHLLACETGSLGEVEVIVVDDGSAAPAAEEYEWSLRRRQRGVPICLAPWIVAWHDHPVAIDAMCRQQYKHAVGCAEAAVKCPATLDLPELRQVIAANGPVASGDSLRQ